MAVLWLASALMLAASALPWVLLRPNRLAQGHYLHLPAAGTIAAAVLALAIPLVARRWPVLLGVLGSAAMTLGFWWLGTHTSAAVQGQGDFARASASSGVWLWLLGTATTLHRAVVLRRAALFNNGTHKRANAFQVWLQLSPWLWLPCVLALLWGTELTHWSLLQEFNMQRTRFWKELVQHVRLVVGGLGLALVIASPLAVWAAGRAQVANVVLSVTSSIQTIPSLALLGLLIAPLSALSNHFPALQAAGIRGIGSAPALCAMTLYALLPVLRNGIVALRGVPAGVLDAARGMGMTNAQRFWRVQLPLALPLWLSGVRQAAVLLVGVASIAQLIGAGGLGYFIFSGMQSGASDLILLGALPAALLAIALESALRALEAQLLRRVTL